MCSMKKSWNKRNVFPYGFLTALVLGSATAHGEEIQRRSVEGVVAASHSWELSPLVNSKIRKLHFIEGQLINEGDLLVEFYSDMASLDLDLAEANLEVGRVRMHAARDVLDRTTKLQEKGAVTEAKFKDASYEFAAADANLRILQIQVEMAAARLRATRMVAPTL